MIKLRPLLLAGCLLPGLAISGCFFAHDAKATVTIDIKGIPNKAEEDRILEALRQMADGSSHSISWFSSGSELTVTLSPVSDVQAFTKKIKFGKVTKVDLDKRALTVDCSP